MKQRIFLTIYFFCSLALTIFGQGREINVNIMVTSDVHGRYFSYDFVENAPRTNSLSSVHQYVSLARTVPGNNIILLDNGDFIQGTPESYYANFLDRSRRNLTSRIMNLMRYDAATVGNHDIEAGPDMYNRLKREFRFPYLGANVINTETNSPHFVPYTIISRQGVRIAVIGLSTTGVPKWLPEKLWKGLEFRDMVATARKWVEHIKENEEVDAIVGLFHSGLGPLHIPPGTLSDNSSLYIASNVPGFDVIFTGHDHREVVDSIKDPDGRQVLIVGAGSHNHKIGIARLTFNRVSRGVHELVRREGELVSTEPIGKSQEFFQTFDNDMQRIASFANTPVTMLLSDIHANEALFGPSAFVDLVHEVQLELTGADISIAAPLTTSGKIPAGLLSTRHFFELYQYENFLYVMELTGQEVRDFLEYSYGLWFGQMRSEEDNLLSFRRNAEGQIITDSRGRHRFMSPTYNFDSMAGISYTVDISQPPGNRVNIMQMENGEPFDTHKVYRVAINSYRASGGGGHLEIGAGLSPEEARKRITFISETDMRMHMINLLKGRANLMPAPRNNWRLIPEDLAKKGIENDRRVLFE